MIAKKNPKADLEKNRFAFFQIGLIVAGSLCLAAFEYTTIQKEPVAHYDIQPLPSTTLIDEVMVEPMAPQQQKQRVLDLNDDIIVTEKIIADPAITIDPGKEKEFDFGDIDTGDDGKSNWTFVTPDVIHDVPEVDPAFPGGHSGMSEFINKYINIPSYVSEPGGTVYVQFVVNKDGSIEQASVIGSVSADLDKAALEVVARMPKWIPGEQDGKSVRSRLTIPINIRLR